MPDASSFIGQRLAGAVVGGRAFAKTHSTMSSIQKKLERHGDAYPRIPLTTIEVYVQGTFKYTSGVYAPGGDYSLIKQAIADAYGVTVAEVELTVLPGSININYRIAGVPTKDPPPQGIAAALTTLIQTYGGSILNLRFENDNTACTYTVTVDPSLVPSNLYSSSAATASATSGYVDVNSLAINYTTPGIYKYRIPAGYSSMTIILGGGGSAGTASLIYSNNKALLLPGVNGSSGGLLMFKVFASRYVGKELIINVGAGGIGYSFDISSDSRALRTAMGRPGQASSIEIDGKIIAIAKGGNSNFMDCSNNDVNVSSDQTYSSGDAAVNYLNIPMSLTSSELATNGGPRGPSTYAEALIFSAATPVWWAANNVGNIGFYPSMYVSRAGNNGGNGYFSLLFNNLSTDIIESLPPIIGNLNPPDFDYTYLTRGNYVIPVPTNYKTAIITIAGGKGGDGYVGPLTNIFDGQGQSYYVSFTIPTKLLGERLNCRVGAGGLGGRMYTIVNNVKTPMTTITGGPGENTVLTSSNGFAITAGGGKDNVCNVTYPVIPESDEVMTPDGEAGHGVEARAGYTGLKYAVENGIVKELFLNFYINSRKTGSALFDFATDPRIQIVRGDGSLILSDASTGAKRAIINSKTFTISVSGIATNNWPMDVATARKSWTYTIGSAVCNPRRNPNIIYKTAGESPVRYNKFDSLDVYPSSPDEPFNTAWTPLLAVDKPNFVEFGYNGRDGECRILFTEYMPFVSNPPIKIIISGNHQSISARYFDENNNDITSTVDNNRKLWIYSNDPEFGKKLTTTTSTDNYARGSEFSLKNPSKITYFMYDSHYDVRSNYLDVDIPQSFSVIVADATIRAADPYEYNLRTFTYWDELNYVSSTGHKQYMFSINVLYLDSYENIKSLPGGSARVKCEWIYYKSVNGTVTRVTETSNDTLDLTKGSRTYEVMLTPGTFRVGRLEKIDLTVTVNNIVYFYNIFYTDDTGRPGRFITGAPYQSAASPISDQFIEYIADAPPATTTTTTTTTRRNTFTSYITSIIASGFANPAQLAIDPSDVLYIANSGVPYHATPFEGSPEGGIKRFNTKTNSRISDGGIRVSNDANIYGVAVNSSLVIYHVDRRNSFADNNSNTTVTLGTPRISSGPNPGYMNNPSGIAVDVRRIAYVANTGDNNIIKINDAGVNQIIVSGLNAPVGIAVDNFNNVYVADTGNNSVKKYNTNGVIMLTMLGFNQPKGVAVDTSGNIYVADTGNNLVKKYNENGVIMATTSGFNQPYGIVVDTVGNVYVSNYGDGKIVKLTPQ